MVAYGISLLIFNISLVHRHSLVRYQVEPVVTKGEGETRFADHKTNIFSLAVLLAVISPRINVDDGKKVINECYQSLLSPLLGF